MILHIKAKNKNDELEDEIVTTYPAEAWNKFQEYTKTAKYIVVKYYYSDGIMSSHYAVDVDKRKAWLFDGDSTPTILKGIQHYLAEVK